MRNRIIAFILVWGVLLGVGAAGYFFFYKKERRNPGDEVLNVVIHEKGVTRTLDGKTVKTGRVLDDIYAKEELTFFNKVKVLQREAPEVIQELQMIGLTREEIITSIASLLGLVDDEMRAKNIATDYIASLGFLLSGDEYVKLLNAAEITDEFYYSNLIKNTAEFVKYPLTSRQTEAILAPLKSSDYRSRVKNMLDREALRQESR